MRLHATPQLDLLIVDSNRVQYPTLATSAKKAELEFAHAYDGHQALRFAAPHSPRLWIVNMVLPDMTGVELLRLIKAKRPSVPFYLISDTYSAEDELAARVAGASGYLSKPLSLTWFELCRAALARQALTNAHHAHNEHLPI